MNYLDIAWSTVSHMTIGGADVGKHYIVLSLPNEGWGPVTFFPEMCGGVWTYVDNRGSGALSASAIFAQKRVVFVYKYLTEANQRPPHPK